MAGRIVVIGHKNPDTDSICAAVAFTELLRHLRPGEQIVSGRAGDLRPETTYLLERFGVDPPELVRDVRVLVVGDRVDVQRAAIERGVGALIVTGGIEVDPEIVKLARRRRVTLMSVPHHTAGTLRLIQMSIPISYIMRREPPSAEPDDLVDDVRGLLGQERALSVVDEGNRVIGVITRADVLRGARRRVALVDRDERGQAVDG